MSEIETERVAVHRSRGEVGRFLRWRRRVRDGTDSELLLETGAVMRMSLRHRSAGSPGIGSDLSNGCATEIFQEKEER